MFWSAALRVPGTFPWPCPVILGELPVTHPPSAAQPDTALKAFGACLPSRGHRTVLLVSVSGAASQKGATSLLLHVLRARACLQHPWIRASDGPPGEEKHRHLDLNTRVACEHHGSGAIPALAFRSSRTPGSHRQPGGFLCCPRVTVATREAPGGLCCDRPPATPPACLPDGWLFPHGFLLTDSSSPEQGCLSRVLTELGCVSGGAQSSCHTALCCGRCAFQSLFCASRAPGSCGIGSRLSSPRRLSPGARQGAPSDRQHPALSPGS